MLRLCLSVFFRYHFEHLLCNIRYTLVMTKNFSKVKVNHIEALFNSLEIMSETRFNFVGRHLFYDLSVMLKKFYFETGDYLLQTFQVLRAFHK